MSEPSNLSRIQPSADTARLGPRETCDCGSRLRDGWCGTCRQFIWQIGGRS